jgi:hypothetical protein
VGEARLQALVEETKNSGVYQSVKVGQIFIPITIAKPAALLDVALSFQQ